MSDRLATIDAMSDEELERQDARSRLCYWLRHFGRSMPAIIAE
jgi:hypothetical protein